MTILAGCGKPAPQPSSSTPANPLPSISGEPTTPNIPPPTPSTTAADNTSTPSSMIQSGIPLKVSDPADGATLSTSTVTVEGQTQPGAVINVNDQVGTADDQGNFNIPISLDSGLNAIDVIATGANGKQGEVLIMVNVDQSQAATNTVSGNSAPASTNISTNTIPLNVISPVDGSNVSGAAVTVTGQTTPEATVSVNDQVDTADDNGNFSIPISLNPGPNSIDVVAVDDNGNQNEVILMVNDYSGN